MKIYSKLFSFIILLTAFPAFSNVSEISADAIERGYSCKAITPVERSDLFNFSIQFKFIGVFPVVHVASIVLDDHKINKGQFSLRYWKGWHNYEILSNGQIGEMYLFIQGRKHDFLEGEGTIEQNNLLTEFSVECHLQDS